MYCPKCGFKNADEMRFCGKCGLELPKLPGGEKMAVEGGLETPATETPIEVKPRPADQASKIEEPEPKQAKAGGKKKGGVGRFLLRLAGTLVGGLLLGVAWGFLRPQVDALKTVYGRNPTVAEAAAQYYIDQEYPELSYASRTVTFAKVDGVACYVVDFVGEEAAIRMLVDRATLEVSPYETIGLGEDEQTAGEDPQAGSEGGQAPSGAELPAIASLVLNDPQLVEEYSFTEAGSSGWSISGEGDTGTIEDGLLTLEGRSSWATELVSVPVGEGQGGVIRFRLSEAPNAVEFSLSAGGWNSNGYRRFGVVLSESAEFLPTVWKGTQNRVDILDNPNLEGTLTVTTEHWYGIFLGADKNGRLRAFIWDWEEPITYKWTYLNGGSDWDNQNWVMLLRVDQGTIQLDDTLLISFTGFR